MQTWARAAGADGSQHFQCGNTGLEHCWMLYPAPESSHYEVLVRVPGGAWLSCWGEQQQRAARAGPLRVLRADGGQPAVL